MVLVSFVGWCGNLIRPNGYRPCLFLFNGICEINYTSSRKELQNNMDNYEVLEVIHTSKTTVPSATTISVLNG